MRRVVMAMMVTAMVAVWVPTVGAQGASLSVTPSTDLLDGDSIHIEAEGPAVAFSAIGQCTNDTDLTSAATAVRTCAIVEFGAGTHTVDWPVRRIITTGTGPEDCLVVGCMIVFGGAGGTFEPLLYVVTHPLTFLEVPILSFSPSADVRDRQTVVVTVSGVDPAASTDVVQCVVEATPLPDGSPGACVDLGPLAGGAALRSTDVVAQRWLVESGGVTVDCAVVSCVLGVVLDDGASVEHLLSAIDFSSNAAVTVTPRTGLVDGQIVEVDATNVEKFDHGTTVVLCLLEAAPAAPVDTSMCAVTDALVDDVIRSTYVSSVTILRHVEVGGESYDCAVGTLPDGRSCSLVLIGRGGPAPDAPISHAAKSGTTHLVVPPLTVAPFGGLTSTQTVDVSVESESTESGFLGVCPRILGMSVIREALRFCEGGEFVSHPAAWETTLVVNRTLEAAELTFDCFSSQCEVVYLAGGDPDLPAISRHRVGINFARSIDFGILQVGLTGQRIAIEAIGYPAGEGVVAVPAQCGFRGAINFDNFFCRLDDEPESEDDFDGDYSGGLTLQRFIPTPSGPPVDCTALPETCGVILAIIGPGIDVLAVPGKPIVVIDEIPF